MPYSVSSGVWLVVHPEEWTPWLHFPILLSAGVFVWLIFVLLAEPTTLDNWSVSARIFLGISTLPVLGAMLLMNVGLLADMWNRSKSSD